MNSDTNRKVFITGGTGKIGRHLVARLASMGFKTKVLSRKQEYPWGNIDNITIIKGDILDQDAVREGVESSDYVFHLAVYQDINDKRKDIFQQVNVEGTKTILNASINSGVKKIVYVSSATVFHATGKTERDEGWFQKTYHPADYYVQTKIEALKFVREAKKKLPIVCVYPTAVIDLEDFSASSPVHSSGLQKFLWDKIGGGIPGGLLGLIGSKDRIFNYIAVEDLVEGLIQAVIVGQPGEEYILGGENITIGNYLHIAAKRLNSRVFPVRFPLCLFRILSRLGRFISLPPIIDLIAQSDSADMCFSSEKARVFLKFEAKIKL